MSEKHFNKLTPAEAERLAILAEECGEIIQVIGKILRHGYQSRHPERSEINREALEREIGNFQVAVQMMYESGDVLRGAVSREYDYKCGVIGRYLHHALPPQR